MSPSRGFRTRKGRRMSKLVLWSQLAYLHLATGRQERSYDNIVREQHALFSHKRQLFLLLDLKKGLFDRGICAYVWRIYATNCFCHFFCHASCEINFYRLFQYCHSPFITICGKILVVWVRNMVFGILRRFCFVIFRNYQQKGTWVLALYWNGVCTTVHCRKANEIVSAKLESDWRKYHFFDRDSNNVCFVRFHQQQPSAVCFDREWDAPMPRWGLVQ